MHFISPHSMTRRSFSAIARKASALLVLFPWRASANPPCCPFQANNICIDCGGVGLGQIIWFGYSGVFYYNATGNCSYNPNNPCNGYSITVNGLCCGSQHYFSYGSVCCKP
jgi:hypothetical protein